MWASGSALRPWSPVLSVSESGPTGPGQKFVQHPSSGLIEFAQRLIDALKFINYYLFFTNFFCDVLFTLSLSLSLSSLACAHSHTHTLSRQSLTHHLPLSLFTKRYEDKNDWSWSQQLEMKWNEKQTLVRLERFSNSLSMMLSGFFCDGAATFCKTTKLRHGTLSVHVTPESSSFGWT